MSKKEFIREFLINRMKKLNNITMSYFNEFDVESLINFIVYNIDFFIDGGIVVRPTNGDFETVTDYCGNPFIQVPRPIWEQWRDYMKDKCKLKVNIYTGYTCYVLTISKKDKERMKLYCND